MTFEAMSEEVLARAGSHQDEARSDPDLAKVEKRQKSPHREAIFRRGRAPLQREAKYAALDKTFAQHPDMILVHGGTPTGGERVAACWARDHNVPQDPRQPDWNRHGKAAPFKRNDAMLEDMPKGVIIFPGSGIQDNLADKARKLGIRIWDFRKR